MPCLDGRWGEQGKQQGESLEHAAHYMPHYN
jgi:hypothetical protein